jgi:serpin B
MKKIISLVLASAILLGMAGCGQPALAEVIQSDKERDTSPMVEETDLTVLVDGNNAFAFDLYQELIQDETNVFYSPYSISEALAMTYAGARTTTEEAMAETLHFTLSQADLHPAFNSLDLQLKERGQGSEGKDGEGFRLNMVNAIWGQKDYKFLDPFLDTLAENYGAGMRIVDFINETEQSRVTINDWVSEQTEDRIKDLIPPGVINFLTRLVLTNAIYFNAAWLYPFEESVTSTGLFHLLDGSDVTVPMMKQTESFRYTEGDNYQAVELPYDGQELSMLIMLPGAGQFDAFEKELDAGLVDEIINKLGTQQVALTMPKFEFESSFGLKEALSMLGMEIAFSEQADLSGMDGGRSLFIQDVIHKAFVSVDEAGTEAAAATAVIVGLTAAPLEQVEVKIDRPFIFLIRDIQTGSIIFVGRVLNPAIISVPVELMKN